MSEQLLDGVPLTALSGVGAAIAEKLSRIGINNVQDLLFHLPYRYEDRTRITPIIDVRPESFQPSKASCSSPKYNSVAVRFYPPCFLTAPVKSR
ncbi:ATP-dependent DNA helicase RecG [Actinobacillus equuli]|nr:ATP-dependent DNA helicase RecG [Actinobacillus equuli]